MTTKFCPNCNAEVPGIANLCKQCFHDFNVATPKKKSALFTILFLLNGMAIVTAIAFAYIHDQQQTSQISVDEETKSIVFTTMRATGPDVDRVYFKDVTSVEYLKNTQPRPFEIAILTTRGERHVYEQSSDPLDFQARQLAEQLDKPLTEKDTVEMPTIKRMPE